LPFATTGTEGLNLTTASSTATMRCLSLRHPQPFILAQINGWLALGYPVCLFFAGTASCHHAHDAVCLTMLHDLITSLSVRFLLSACSKA
jgi:hypothetical protein